MIPDIKKEDFSLRKCDDSFMCCIALYPYEDTEEEIKSKFTLLRKHILKKQEMANKCHGCHDQKVIDFCTKVIRKENRRLEDENDHIWQTNMGLDEALSQYKCKLFGPLTPDALRIN